jgi:acetyl esterase/lipase
MSLCSGRNIVKPLSADRSKSGHEAQELAQTGLLLILVRARFVVLLSLLKSSKILGSHHLSALIPQCHGRSWKWIDVFMRQRLVCSSSFLIFLYFAFAANAETMSSSKKTYTYKTAVGCSIRADVYRPNDDRIRPVILWIHGGALIFGRRDNIKTRQLERYLEAGFAVVAIDYRLAPETKLPDILEDVQDAYGWIRAKGPELFRIDPNRIAVVGHSAGGYLTLTTGYRLRPRPQALVSFYGYGDITGAWYSRPDPFYLKEPLVTREKANQAVGQRALSEPLDEAQRGTFYLYCRQQGLWPKEVAGHDAESEPRAFDPFCPVRNVSEDYPPTLLLHGDKDTDVPFEQSEQMAQELGRHGIEYEFIRISNGPHGFDSNLDDPQVAKAFDRVMGFLKAYLK